MLSDLHSSNKLVLYYTTTQYNRIIRLIWLKFDTIWNLAAARQVPWFLTRRTDAARGSEHRIAQSSLAPPSTQLAAGAYIQIYIQPIMIAKTKIEVSR